MRHRNAVVVPGLASTPTHIASAYVCDEQTASDAEEPSASGYHYDTPEPAHTSTYLWPPVLDVLDQHFESTKTRRVFEVGCGNGAFACVLSRRGYDVTGIDPSVDGIKFANRTHPELALHPGSAYDRLADTYGRFPAVVSLEVVEHVYAPRAYAATVFDLLERGGLAIISTPYHGYLKNLAIALAGKSDQHLSPLWDHGHIKFWSVRTLSQLLREAGFADPKFIRVGRIPQLAKSMIAIARRP